MKKITLLIIIMLLLMLVFTGCELRRGLIPQPFKPKSGLDYHTGTDGLVFSFLDQAPPFSVFEGAEFDVQAIIHNAGAFDVAEDYAASISLIYDNNLIESVRSLSPQGYADLENIQLYGKSYYYSKGQKNYFAIDRFRVKPFDTNHETKTVKFTATITYPYKTFFADDVCVDTDPDNIRGVREACDVINKKYSGGQGAPVAITAVESKMLPRGYYTQPTFTIHIAHVGEGLIWNFDEDNFVQGVLDPLTNTIPSIVNLGSNLEPNQMQVKAFLGSDPLSCTQALMIDGEAKIDCILPENTVAQNAASYVSSLQVELAYFYQQTYTKEIEVRRSSLVDVEQNSFTANDYCAPWETLGTNSNGQQECISNCEWYARTGGGALVTQGLRPLNNNWNLVGCIYTDPTTCRNAKGSCLLESRELCMTGTYCGWPSCLVNNRAPIIPSSEVWEEGIDVKFTCYDYDDKVDVERTCGCKDIAYYKILQEGENCRSIEQSALTPINGFYSQGLRKTVFTVPGGANKKLCLQVEDWQGLRSGVVPVLNI